MKTLLLSLLLASAATHAQTVLRVNNTVGSAAPYTTIAAAVTAAGVNDIIMVEGSNTNYGDISIAKKVTIIGPGYFLAENLNLQATPLSALVNSIALNSGADGTSISGLIFTSPTTKFVINNVSNISLTNSFFNGGNCSFTSIYLAGTGTNLRITNNFSETTCGTPFFILNAGSFSQVIVSNNFSYAGISTGATSSFIISNNTFGGFPGFPTSIDARNSTIQNNIFGLGGNISNGTGSTIKNNVFVAAQSGVDATNLINQPLASLFVGLAGNTTDTQWRLKAGSPAIGAGVGGTDCGMYGGTTPYRPSGIAVGQPTITDYVFPSTVPKNGVLNVKVSGKVN